MYIQNIIPQKCVFTVRATCILFLGWIIIMLLPQDTL